jgi:dnd system-associated protein 4
MGKPIIQYEKGPIYETLVDDYEVFDYYYDVLVFLAVIGYRENKVKRTDYKGSKKDGTKGEAGLQNVYSRDLYRTVAACLAFQDTNDPKNLVNKDAHMRVLAQYSAGGLEVANLEFGSVSGDPTDAIVSYIKDRHNSAGLEEQDTLLSEIVKSFDDEMMGASTE